VKKRIYGLESEYGIIFTTEGKKTLPVEKAVRYLFEKLDTMEGFLNVFFDNGAKFYLDTGYHPEYATPECASLKDLICYDKAGERIIEDLLHFAERRATKEGLVGNLSIFKNNTDFVGNSYGCHENYLVDRTIDFNYLAERLIPFLVVRQVYTGAGKVFKTRWGTDYFISQRAEHVCQKISGATTNDRSIINTRDEPHADREKYRRLHVIVGDSNMSEYTAYLKVGTTALVLEVIEEGGINKNFALRNPVKAIKDISHDTTLSRRVDLEDGRKMSALEIQRAYYELTMRHFEDREADSLAADILRKWGQVLDALETDPMKLDRQVDWIIKKNLIERYQEHHKISWNNDRLLMLDLQYHNIRRDRGLYYILERAGLVDRVLSDEEIEEARTKPPDDTRAKLRGAFIRLAREKRLQYDIDWSYIRLNNFLNIKIVFDDPFQTENPEFTELMDRIRRSSARDLHIKFEEQSIFAHLPRGLSNFFYR
jgi:proteasome accessory factor A